MRRRQVLPGRFRLPAVGVLVALAAVLGACGGGGDDGGGGEGKTVDATATGKVTVDAFDIHFDVGTIKAAPGPLEVTLVEKGSLEHTFEIVDQDFKLTVTASEELDSGTVTLAAGTYTYRCDVPGHEGQGMHGEIVVEEPPS